MSKIIKLIAVSLVGFAAGAHAAERPFVGITWGETKANFSSSDAAYANTGVDVDRVIDETDTWGLRGGLISEDHRYYGTYTYVSGHGDGATFRKQELNVSYDHFLPLTDTARLFGGASVGATYLGQVSGGVSSDRAWGLNAGLQAGVLQDLGEDLQLELGYRYTRYHDTRLDLASGPGDARLNSTKMPYIGLNMRF